MEHFSGLAMYVFGLPFLNLYLFIFKTPLDEPVLVGELGDSVMFWGVLSGFDFCLVGLHGVLS